MLELFVPSAETTPGNELVAAAAKGDNSRVEQLLTQGALLNVRDRYTRQTPLEAAAFAGHVATANLLLDRKAQVQNALGSA